MPGKELLLPRLAGNLPNEIMTIRCSLLLSLLCSGLSFQAAAATLIVNTTNNVSPAVGQTSLLQALQQAKDSDEIQFNIPGTGPYYLQTPAAGYPLITANNLVINGYSQPGSSPNTNSILSPNNARIQIVLDSRGGGYTPMDVPLANPNDDPSFSPVNDGALLGFVAAQNVRVQGLSFLGVPQGGPDSVVTLSFIALANGASGHINGCWLGVDPDGHSVSAAAEGIIGLRYRARTAAGTVTDTVLINGVVIGVDPGSSKAVAQFNVLAGMPVNPVVIEGDNTRISGNFITVLPDGLHDVDVALNPSGPSLPFRGAIQIGRGGNNTLIGTDGDGVNDENERNVFGGMLPTALGGYDHLIAFSGQNPGTNIVVAGNYVGIGIDAKTKFTNGVPVLNGSGLAAQYRIGSDFNGVSDALEGNLIANNYPSSLFPASAFPEQAESLSFLSELNPGATVSLRGNSLINNFPFPVSPLRDGGAFLANYYAAALLDSSAGVTNLLATNSTRLQLVGAVPVANKDVFPITIVDLYIADPVGLTNGQAAKIPELPQGFVQGLTYLASFEEGSAADLDPAAGTFKFDLSKLNIPAGSQLTVTANYTSPVGGGSTGEAPIFSLISRGDDGLVTISWDNGSLQSAPTVLGTWTDESTSGNSIQVTPTEPLRFYRLISSGGGSTGQPGLTVTSPFSNMVEVR
jgi:hypothetical protein